MTGEGHVVGEAEPLHAVGLGDIAADDDHAGRGGVIADVHVEVSIAGKSECVAGPPVPRVLGGVDA